MKRIIRLVVLSFLLGVGVFLNVNYVPLILNDGLTNEEEIVCFIFALFVVTWAFNELRSEPRKDENPDMKDIETEKKDEGGENERGY